MGIETESRPARPAPAGRRQDSASRRIQSKRGSSSRNDRAGAGRRRPRKGKRDMRRYLGVSLGLLGLLFLLPLATMLTGWEEQTEPEAPPPETVKIQLLPPGETDNSYTLRVLLNGEVQEMTMAEYLHGVVRAEMPASFEQEALCAQAVAARTYTLYKMASGGNHGAQADICGDPTCCQAYLDEAQAMANWGAAGENNEAKIENAVAATDGQTILYEGSPVLAVFHSSSAGQTKSAGQVWINDLPYLQSVSSPEGEGVPNYYSRVEVPAEEFRSAFLAAHPEADLSGPADGWVRDVQVNGSSVDQAVVCGAAVRGTELRAMFSLRSASFEIEAQADRLVFYVTGYGHGVGMSQYGAEQMAKDGAAWRDIITHYYTGVTVATYMPEQIT